MTTTSKPRTLQGVERVIESDGSSRWARFRAADSDEILCSVNQRANPAATPIVMRTCFLCWSHSQLGGANTIDAALLTEALRQAVELAQKWDQDTGKPYKEVLL